jgi:hypothetical protein
MNFDKMFTWIIAIVLGYAAVGKIDTLQRWIWTAQAKVIAESRTSNWGSPRFFPERGFAPPTKSNGASK